MVRLYSDLNDLCAVSVLSLLYLSCLRGSWRDVFILYFFMSSRRKFAGGAPVLAALPALVLAAFSHAQTQNDSSTLASSVTDKPLPQVVVTGTRYEEEVQVIPAHVITISRDQIATSNVSTVNEAIMRFGGIASRVSLSGGNELTADPMGFGDAAGANFMVLVDGVPMREGDASEVRLSGIPIESVERVEIQKGSAAVLYGGGSTAGVVNIITRASAPGSGSGTTASAYMGVGSFSTYEARANARYTEAKMDLTLSAANRRSDGFRIHSGSESRDVYLAAKFATDSVRFGVNLRSETIDARTAGPISVAQFQANRHAAQADSVTFDTRSNTASNRLSAFAETEAAGVVWRLDASTRTRDFDFIAVYFGAPTTSIYDGTDHHVGISGIRSDKVAMGENRLVFGVERSDWRQKRSYPGSTLGDYSLKFNGIAYYIKDDFDIPSIATRFTAGYRYENSERSQLSLPAPGQLIAADYAQSAWEFGASHALTQNDSIYARESTSYRFANIDEFTTSYSGANLVSLLPQTSRDHELGWKHRFDDRGRIDLRVYQSDLDNEIIYDVVNYNNINLDATRRRGLDIDAGYQLSSRIFAGGSLAFRDARFTAGANSGKVVPLSAREIATLRGEYAFDKASKLGVLSQWVSGQFIAGDFGNQIRMPSYGITDVYYQRKIGKVDLSFKVQNLFDKSYYSYATLSGGSTAVYPDAGRSFWLSARVGF